MNSHPVVKGKLVCVALNDQKQVEAMQSEFSEAPYKAAPTEPVLYFKPRNTWNGEDCTLTPDEDQSFVVGASLAVVFDKECCRVRADDAQNYVGGYTILHDISLPEESYYRPDIKGKCLDGSAPLSETVTSLDTLDNLTVITRVNDEVKAELRLSGLHYSVPELIEKVSHIMTLDAGDVLAVGFVGERVPVLPGDKIVSIINDIGALTTFIGGNK